MRAIYWEPRKVSRTAVVVICLIALTGVATSELCKRNLLGLPDKSAKYAASKLAEDSMHTIKEERLARGHEFDPQFDIAMSGMIGEYLTPTTSVTGHLESKQTSVNPNFAGAIVDMLQKAGVKEGDVVAVGCSGSFPALNLCTCCALETIGAKPIIIASTGASQFGANRPDLLWIDIEHLLHDKGHISFRSVAASLGGYEDQAVGMSEEGRQLLLEGIERNNLPLIQDEEFTNAIDTRMAIYNKYAEGQPIKAYINVGGGTVSVGRSVGKKLYEPGLNLTATEEAMEIDSVMTRFAKQGTPLIHMVEIMHLAKAYHLPPAPVETPAAGEGWLFYDTWMHRWFAAGFLLVLGVAFAKLSRQKSSEAPSILT
ncbi:MAG: poly-gamma-glutamate system protein, partial [Planctomycetaceae bacterium]|nr:poly-gamma-glutamate system protein [Planctomycetaceae bacterium]